MPGRNIIGTTSHENSVIATHRWPSRSEQIAEAPDEKETGENCMRRMTFKIHDLFMPGVGVLFSEAQKKVYVSLESM